MEHYRLRQARLLASGLPQRLAPVRPSICSIWVAPGLRETLHIGRTHQQHEADLALQASREHKQQSVPLLRTSTHSRSRSSKLLFVFRPRVHSCC